MALPKRDVACATCVLNSVSSGFLSPEGSGEGKVVVVDGIGGKADIEASLPMQGSSGYLFNRCLQKSGIKRRDIILTNTLRCAPPFGEDVPLTRGTTHCTFHYLDPFLRSVKPGCILAIGPQATNVLAEQPLEYSEYDHVRGYPFWSRRYNCWVLPTFQPSRILQGQFHEEPILIHDIQRAADIAANGYQPVWGQYLLDPPPQQALAWARAAVATGVDIEFDIETPGKAEKGEEGVSLRDAKTKILRISFAVKDLEGMSVPYSPEYMPAIKLLLECPQDKGAWNKLFDVTILNANGQHVEGVVHDGQVAWHVLHSDLEKGLGFVATFVVPEQPRWKHLSNIKPAFYNAVDSDVQRRARHRIWKLLRECGLWEVYERHVLRVHRVTKKMSDRGMPQDAAKRLEAAKLLEAERAEVMAKLEQVVPAELRKLSPKDGFKKTPKDTTGMREIRVRDLVSRCAVCGMVNPTKAHVTKKTVNGFGPDGKRLSPKKRPVNPCFGAETVTNIEEVVRYAKVLPLKLSPQLILGYQKLVGHPWIYERAQRGPGKKPTSNENSLKQQLLKYTEDPFYPLVLRERKIKGIAGNFIGRVKREKDGTERVVGGVKVSPDGRVHTTFTDKPSTLRMATENPGMQNHPRPEDPLSALCRGVYIGAPDEVFIARDFKSIEAKLVGWFAGSRNYYYISGMDAHTFVTAHWMHYLGKLPYADTPQIDWPEGDLVQALAALKKRFPERQGIKVMTHASNYLAKARMVQRILFDELGWVVPLAEVKKFLDFYKELFPEIPAWHRSLARQVDGTEADEILSDLNGLSTGVGYIRNPFGYIHRFAQVIRWEKVFGKWEWYLGPGANKAIAFPAQSTAAGIAKEALIAYDEEYPELCDGPDGGLVLFAHDELMGIWKKSRAEDALASLKAVMERPWPQLPLDPSWGMGEYLSVATEAKIGPSWGTMQEVKE